MSGNPGTGTGTDDGELPTYAKLPLALARGEGAYVFTEDGERYLDLYGGHAVALCGHSPRAVADAVAAQARSLLFYSNTVRSRVRAEATERLLRHVPWPGYRVFYVNSGAEANEAAMRLARRATTRPKVVSFVGSFHGRTIGALSATGIAKYHEGLGPSLAPGHVHVPFGDAAALERAVDADTAAVLMEPIQSIAGVVVAPLDYYGAAEAIARERGALLIFDEVQTGLGRTGTFLFAEKVGVRPDLVTLAKGLGSGFPVACVLAAPDVAGTVKVGDLGSTFGGGPVARAAMAATLDLIDLERLPLRADQLGARLTKALAALPGVRAVRGAGLLLGLELEPPRTAARVQAALLERHVIAGTSNDPQVLRLLPPLVLTTADVDRALAALREVLGS